MTPEQSTELIPTMQSLDDVYSSWPLAYLSGTSEDFCAYDVDKNIFIRGIYAPKLTLEAFNRALEVANNPPVNPVTKFIGMPEACIIAPKNAVYAAFLASQYYQYDWESLFDNVLIYSVEVSYGALVFEGDTYNSEREYN